MNSIGVAASVPRLNFAQRSGLLRCCATGNPGMVKIAQHSHSEINRQQKPVNIRNARPLPENFKTFKL